MSKKGAGPVCPCSLLNQRVWSRDRIDDGILLCALLHYKGLINRRWGWCVCVRLPCRMPEGQSRVCSCSLVRAVVVSALAVGHGGARGVARHLRRSPAESYGIAGGDGNPTPTALVKNRLVKKFAPKCMKTPAGYKLFHTPVCLTRG